MTYSELRRDGHQKTKLVEKNTGRTTTAGPVVTDLQTATTAIVAQGTAIYSRCRDHIRCKLSGQVRIQEALMFLGTAVSSTA